MVIRRMHAVVRPFLLGHHQSQLDPALADDAGLLLQDAEHLRLALLGAHVGDPMDHVVQPLPLPAHLFFPCPQDIQVVHVRPQSRRKGILYFPTRP